MDKYTHKYAISFQKSTAKMLLTYRNGHIKRIEMKSGSMDDKQWRFFPNLIPQMEKDMEDVKKAFGDAVNISLVSEQDAASLYQQFVAVYFNFHTQFGFAPKMNAVEGAALKQIITYLNEQSTTEEESLHAWKQILSNWDKVEEYYQKQIKLSQINSNLTNLMLQIKHGKKGATNIKAASGVASDIREEL